MFRASGIRSGIGSHSLLPPRIVRQRLPLLSVGLRPESTTEDVAYTANQAERTVSHTDALKLSDLPGPCKYIPYFGTFFLHARHEGKPSMLKKHLEWTKLYGKIYKETILGNTLVYVNDVESVEKVCRAEGSVPDRHFFPVNRGLKEIKKASGLALGIADSDQEEWLRKRRIFSKRLLRPVEMKNYFTLFSDSAVDAIKMIKRNRNEDNILEDQKKYLIRWSMDSFSTFVFGKPLGFMLDDPTEDAIATDQAMSTLLTDIVNYAMVPSALRTVFTKSFNSAKTGLELFYEITGRNLKEMVNRREKEGFGEDHVFSFADYILSQDNLSMEECTAYVSDIFGGGYDTTTTTMDAVLYLIGKHPNIQEKLYQEICNSLPKNGVLDYNASQRMPYMRAVLKEVFRLYPIGPLLPRSLKEDIILNGYLIPKDTTMLLHVYALSRNEKHFDEPLVFKPERWLRGADNLPDPYLSLPFGTGARSCIGRRVAEGNIFAFMAQFFKAFKIEQVLNEYQPVVNVLLQSSQPLSLKLSDR